MSRPNLRNLALALIATPTISAAAPKVATDIPAVHSIAAAVMEGAGAPTLVMAPGASPHGYAMRPSEAAALAEAEVVFWIGPALTPWLDRALGTLGANAEAVEMTEAPGVRLLDRRESAAFESHEEHEAEDGDEGHGDHGDHGEAADPHIWLDPANGQAMAQAMAETLAAADPANAELYRSNAQGLAARLALLQAEIASELAPVRGRPFVVFHDAYHYFEARFGIEAAGAVSISDAAEPGPARIETVRSLIEDAGAACVFAEPQFDPMLITRLIEGTAAKVGRLDPHGSGIAPGPELYPQLLKDLAAGLADCLAG